MKIDQIIIVILITIKNLKLLMKMINMCLSDPMATAVMYLVKFQKEQNINVSFILV
jgi:hypothetical protein